MFSTLDIINSCAGVSVVIVGAFGLRQIALFKHDMRLRNERAAKEKAIEYALRYLSVYCKAIIPHLDQYRKQNLKPYSGPIGDFTMASIPREYRKNAVERFKIDSWLDPMNELLAISASFTSGVADEQTGFSIFGRAFCGSVQNNYDLLSLSRSENVHDYFQSIIDLYQIWSPRLSRAELEDLRSKVSEAIESKNDKKIPPIGCDDQSY